MPALRDLDLLSTAPATDLLVNGSAPARFATRCRRVRIGFGEVSAIGALWLVGLGIALDWNVASFYGHSGAAPLWVAAAFWLAAMQTVGVARVGLTGQINTRLREVLLFLAAAFWIVTAGSLLYDGFTIGGLLRFIWPGGSLVWLLWRLRVNGHQRYAGR